MQLAKRYDATTNNFIIALRHLKDRNEITLEQYATSLRRAKEADSRFKPPYPPISYGP